MLKVESLSCGYGGPDVVQGLSLEVKEGQRLCILGPNGCGKTTLLRAIAGLLPYRGQVWVEGRDLQSLSRRKVAQEIALMSQISSVYFSYTVYETVCMGRYAHRSRDFLGREEGREREIVMSCLERTGIADLKDRLITQLSGGQLQRVFLARTFAQDPHMILLDEPTNHLDLKYQLELMETLKEWSSKPGRCVVGVLHDINLALSFADRILLMESGREVACAGAQEFDLSEISRIYQMDVREYMLRSLRRWEEKP